jgi:heat shock protein HtpX
VAATLGGAISSLAYMLMWFGGGSRDEDGEGTNPLVGLAMLILAPIAAMLIQAAISRSREYNADTVGAEISGDPRDLASALEMIHHAARQIPLDVNPAYNSLFIAEPLNAIGSKIGNLFSTHPPLEKRLENLLGAQAAARYRYAA